MHILIACECSGRVREAFRNRSHDAWSCDLKPAEDGSKFHYQMDVKELLSKTAGAWDQIVAHPVCTYMAISGVRWCTTIPANPKPYILYGPERVAAIAEAAEFARYFSGKAPRVAIENPIGLLSSRWRKPDQTVQPWWFGEPFFKGTCFWLEGLAPLKPTNKLTPPKPGTDEHKQWSAVHRAPPGTERQRDRSVTFQGIANAMAEQWG